MGGHKERQASVNRREGVRSRYKRCPRCKKLRMYWWGPNHMNEKRTVWRQLVAGEGKICGVCIDRAKGKVKEPKPKFNWADAYIEKLKEGFTVKFRPKGNSMKPRIESGWEVTVRPLCCDADVQVDSVVLCTVGAKQYLHRVSKINLNPAGLHSYEISNQAGRVNGWIFINNIHGLLTHVQP